MISAEKNKDSVAQQVSIDEPNIQYQAAEILEGGEAAFNVRKDKYGF